MVINKDQSALAASAGNPPDSSPRFVTALADRWYKDYVDGGNEDRSFAVPGTRWRASWAAGCARKVAYSIDHADARRQGDDDRVVLTKPSNPPTVADLWRMNLGTMVHTALEEIFPAAFPGADIELAVDLRPEVDGSATSDIVVRQPDGKVIVVELKTKNGFGYKLATTNFKGPPDGPSYNHKVQAAVLAHALGADELVVGYLAMECISPGLADGMGLGDVGRFAAEWTYPKEVFTPWALQEHKRVGRIISVVDSDGPSEVPRAVDDDEVPREARIVDPSKGAWEVRDADGVVTQVGRTWFCSYCSYQDRCCVDG